MATPKEIYAKLQRKDKEIKELCAHLQAENKRLLEARKITYKKHHLGVEKMAKITAKEIFQLNKRDFENGAILEDIYDTLKAYEQLQVENKKLQEINTKAFLTLYTKPKEDGFAKEIRKAIKNYESGDSLAKPSVGCLLAFLREAADRIDELQINKLV